MQVEVVDGQYVVDAPWLEEPVVADTWTEAYWLALAEKHRRVRRLAAAAE